MTDVDPDSVAAERALRPGDVIVEVQSQPVHSPDEVAHHIEADSKAGKKVELLLVNRNGDLDLRGAEAWRKVERSHGAAVRDDFVFAISLQIKQRRQIAMRDAGRCGGGDDRLGVIGDAQVPRGRSWRDRWRRRRPPACPRNRDRLRASRLPAPQAWLRVPGSVRRLRPIASRRHRAGHSPVRTSKPAAAATRCVKNAKPPDTSNVFAPCARIVATRAFAPGLSRTRSS